MQWKACCDSALQSQGCCLTACISPWVFCLNMNSSWAGKNPELNRKLLSFHREKLSWFFMKASRSQPKYSSLIPRAVITWDSVVSSTFTEKMWIFWEKTNQNTTIFKGLLQTFRASHSLSFSCQLKLNSSQSRKCEREYHIFSLFSHELVLLSRALLQKWAMPLIL